MQRPPGVFSKKSARLTVLLLVAGIAIGAWAYFAGVGAKEKEKLAREVPRPVPDGRYLLPSGWSISPAGRQMELGGFPLKVVPFPDQRHVLVTSNGYTENFVAVVDSVDGKVTHRVPI